MSKRWFLTAMVVALAVVISVGGLLASNMGFKLNKQMFGATPSGTAKVGQNYLSLPFFRQTGLNTAKDLAIDIGCANVSELRRYVESSNTFQIYRCPTPPAGTNFNLGAGEGVLVVSKNVPNYNYIVVGSHDPAQTVTINGTPGAKVGRNVFAMPYHFTGTTAKDLATDIGCTNVSEIRRYVSSSNSFQIYRCPTPPAGTNFTLTPGESYDVYGKAGVSYSYIPSHY